MNKHFIKLFTCFVFVGAGLTSCHKYKMEATTSKPVIATSQWTRLDNLPAENITALEIFGNTIYAASSTSGKVFESSDNGASWSSTAPVAPGLGITAIALFKNRLYVGTGAGNVYSSADNGKTWANEGNTTFSVVSFTVWNDNLYAAAIDNSGRGLLMMQAPEQWTTFQNGLGNAVRVSKIMVVNNVFVAGTTDFFAAYNAAQQIWQTKPYVDITKTVYKNAPFPNLVIDMVTSQGSIFAQIYVGNNDQESILRSDDNGLTIHFDTVGLKADTDNSKYLMQGMYADNNKLYSIIDQEKGTKGTWLQSRAQNAVLGSTWATGEEFLAGIQAHVLRSSADVLFLATDSGLYFKKAN